MRKMTNAAVVCFVVLGSVVLAGRASASYGRTKTLIASQVLVFELVLEPGEHTFETMDLSQGGDTVIHLWDVTGGTEVGMNDDYDRSLRSKLVVTLPSGGQYLLVVRSDSNGSLGTCTVKIDVQEHPHQFFAGYHADVATIHSADTVSTVLENPGTGDTTLFGLNTDGHLTAVDDDAGVGWASKVTGVFTKVVIGTRDTLEGATTLVVNDAGSDADGDGLGAYLEAALCTCDSTSQTTCSLPCSNVRSPVDSDADGIRDGYEVYGLEGDPSEPYDYDQHLPMWGAEPARKDVFVEVDYLYSDTNKMTSTAAVQVAASYDQVGSAAYLKNRDGSDGIKVHLDIGVTSTGTTYGDWGGAASVPSGQEDSWKNPTYQQFAKVRRNIFHYAHAIGSGGGTGLLRDWKFRANKLNTKSTFAHELGHNLDLRHGGRESRINQNGKPQYISVMNYGMQWLTTEFSMGQFENFALDPTNLCEADGLHSSDPADVDHLKVAPYFYTVESSPCSGDGNSNCGVDWNRDGQIKECGITVRAAPNYQKNAAASPELGRYYRYLHLPDKSFADPPFKYSESDKYATPSTARAFGKMYLTYRTKTGAIKLLYTSHDFKSQCPDLYKGCASWGALTVTSSSDPAGPALALYSGSGPEHLVLVYKTSGLLAYYKINSSHQIVYGGQIPGTSGALFEPVLGHHNGALLLLYRKGTSNQEGPVYANTYNSSGWTSSAAQYEGTQQIQAMSTAGLVASTWGTYGVFTEQISPQMSLFWMSYSGSNSWVRLYNTQMETHWICSDDAPKRIGIAWRTDSTLLFGGRFYLAYNDVCKSASVNRGFVMMDMTDGSLQLKWNSLTQYDNESHTTSAGMDLFGGYPGPSEESLRMADVVFWEPPDKLPNLHNPLEFRPFADGILSVALKDSNDFEVMERGLCASLHSCTATICTGAGGGDICLGGSGGGEVQCQ